MYLNMLMSQLMKIRTRNTTPMPIRVFIPALESFSPVVYSGEIVMEVIFARSSSTITENSAFLFSNTAGILAT